MKEIKHKIILNKMKKNTKKILADIDATINQLIENPQVSNRTKSYSLFHEEMRVKQNLLAQLVYIQELLNKNQRLKPVEEKILKNKMIGHFSHRTSKIQSSNALRLGRNRKKGKG